MNILKNYRIKRQIKRLDRLIYLLDTNAQISNLEVVREVITDDWYYYFHLSGFIGEKYFAFFVWEHRETGKTRCSVCDTTDREIVESLIFLVKKLSKIELDQKMFSVL